MKYINTFSEDVRVSQVALGCMRIGGMTEAEADAHILGAVECGINYFDHAADIEMSREDWYKIYLAAGYRLP